MEKEEIDFHSYIEERLIDKRIFSIRRMHNILLLGIGEPVTTKNVDGMEIIASEVEMHIQSTWRIVNKEKNKIWLASSDFYSPSSSIKTDRNFKWYAQEMNLFDEKSQLWFDRENPIYIRDYKSTEWGDLFLYFSNGDCLEIWVDASDETECWRIFKYNVDDIHCVITGNGLSYE